MNLAPGVSFHEYETKQKRKQREEDIKKGKLSEENTVLEITDFDIKSNALSDAAKEKELSTVGVVSTVTNKNFASNSYEFNQHNWTGPDNKNNDSIKTTYHNNDNITYNLNRSNDNNNQNNNFNSNVSNGSNNNFYNNNQRNYIPQQQQQSVNIYDVLNLQNVPHVQNIPNVHNISSSYSKNVLHPQAYSSLDRKDPPVFLPPPQFPSFAPYNPTQQHTQQQPTQQHPQIQEYFARLKNSQLNGTEQNTFEKNQICMPVSLGEINADDGNNSEISSFHSSTSTSSFCEKRGVKRPHI